ncbi:NAD(P)-dependent oxidoreductase [Paenibacillus mesophilus]|uniref:NAD(P)-dependent oxidoreductase n=1 Tax=Paenibacillus mesophilus TaxID=2582849 RepID=UPI00192E44EB|nr:NAD(P)-dependent oxidoreductase [Paenibacillus mesophilus]
MTIPNVIVVHPSFEQVWPYTADRLRQLLGRVGDFELIRLPRNWIGTLAEAVAEPEKVTRLVTLAVPVTTSCLDKFTSLREAYIGTDNYAVWRPEELYSQLKDRGVSAYVHPSEGYWGQSVSEFALGLTICALRRIPQTHHEIIASQQPWKYEYQQFGDDPRFVNGTVEGKRVRIVGAGNIASRYASFVNMLGADVAVWDPYAAEPAFHRAGSRKEWYLERLVQDAEIFVPMVPLTEGTKGIVTAEHIRMLPQGCIVVLATRAGICDTEELRRRVLADELSLAADVFDIEPLPLDDPLLGRHNVVHTPHNAGRTKEANFKWAEIVAAQFK